MSGLFDCLNDNGLSMSLYYYGANDAITSFELAEIINNPSFFSDVFSQVQLKDVSSAEDFYKYICGNGRDIAADSATGTQKNCRRFNSNGT